MALLPYGAHALWPSCLMALLGQVLSINPVPLDNAVYLRYAQLLINTTNNENIVQAKEISLKVPISKGHEL